MEEATVHKKRVRSPVQYQRAPERYARALNRRNSGFKSRVSAVLELTASLATAVEDLKYVNLPAVDDSGFYEQVQRFEISLIERALSETSGSQVKAARLLKMNLTTLNSKIKKYGLDPQTCFRLRKRLVNSKPSAQSDR